MQSPEYRDNKERTILNMLPDLLGKQKGADLAVRAVTATGPTTLQDMQAVLISNNPYGSGRLLDMGRRYRLDEGVLGVIAGRFGSTAEAVGLLRRQQFRSVNALTAVGEVVVQSTDATIPVGIDGEAVTVDTPVHCTIRPRALRVQDAQESAGRTAATAAGSTGNGSGRSRSAGSDAAWPARPVLNPCPPLGAASPYSAPPHGGAQTPEPAPREAPQRRPPATAARPHPCPPLGAASPYSAPPQDGAHTTEPEPGQQTGARTGP